MNTFLTKQPIRVSQQLITFLFVIVLALTTVLSVKASQAEVTRGKFTTFSSGIQRGYIIGGQAVMTRTADDKTIVKVFASGLSPKTAYGVHVHNQACANGFGGGHYQQNPADGVNNMNEIWPGFTTDEMGIGYGKATHQYRARPEAQISGNS
jgi:hypothetical protein